MVHLCRAEISRANTWRQRLDSTTNWAVLTTGASISFVFTEALAHHSVIFINALLVTLVLFIEESGREPAAPAGFTISVGEALGRRLPSVASPDSRLLYRFPKPDVNGRTEILLTPLELLQRLARFVPPPRVHRHRYHGVLAPNATLRPQVVAIGRIERRAEAPEPDDEAASPRLLPEAGPAPASPVRIRWAVLLARIYLLRCCRSCARRVAVR